MKHQFIPKGTCSKRIDIDIEADIVRRITFTDGCDGNLQAISRLTAGMPVDEVIERCRGIRCGRKKTSCADQLTLALEQAKAAEAEVPRSGTEPDMNAQGNRYHRQELADGFRRLGIQAGDDVMMHVSLSSFGWVEGGPETLIDALLDVLGAAGTLLVPTLIFRGSMFEFVQTDPVYDVRHTPSRSGLVTETLRLRPQARRSLHPTSPVAAIGARAAWYTQSHHLEPLTVGGASSPWALLRRAPRGLVLLAGVGFSRCSLLHGVEDDLEPPYHFAPGVRQMSVLDAAGETQKVNLRVYNKVPDRNFAKVDRLFAEDPAIRHGKVGDSTCVLGTAAHIYDRTAALVREDPDWFRKAWSDD